ncbi:WD40 repeat domain-containing protein [Inquilinus sp. YAF38]|uniref:WD40 repeat domain-containing protein n=1 Tax=Inquilinus sp. YAF38 TaxID=3233084 RepID=UPI003F93EFC1
MRSLWQRLNAGLRRAPRLVRRAPATGLVLLCALTAGFGVQWLVGDAVKVLDGEITRPEAEHEVVTSLVWLTNGQLAIGTASGAVYSHFLSSGQTIAATVARQPIADIVALPDRTESGADAFLNVSFTADLTRKFDPEAPPPSLRRVLLAGAAMNLGAEDGLFAIGGENSTRLVVGRTALLGNQQQQQQVAPRTPVTGLLRYDIGPDGKPKEIGQVGGLWDVRALAAAPDGTFAVAGAGDGQVVAIDLAPTDPSQAANLAMSRVGRLGGPVVAVAAGGTKADPVIAAAGADGRVVVFRTRAVREGPPDLKTSGGEDNFIYGSYEVGLPAANWSPFMDAGGSEVYDLVGVSQDGRQVVIHRETSGYFLEKIGDDGSIVESTQLDSPYAASEDDGSLVDSTQLVPPFTASDALLQVPGVAEAVFLGGSMREPARQAIAVLSTTLAESKGEPITRVILDRLRTRGAIETADGRIFLFTAQDPNPVDLGVSGSISGPQAFSPQGDMFAVVMADGRLRLYDTASRALIAEGPADISIPKFGETKIAFTSDGKRIVGVTSGGGIRLYSTRTLSFIAEYESHSGDGLADLAESGDFAAYRSGKQSFAVIDLRTGRAIVEATLLDQAVYGLRISADGRTVATVGSEDDRAVLVASTAAKHGADGLRFAQAATPVGPPDRNGLKFSANGSKLMVRTRDGKLYVANISAPDTVELAFDLSESFFRFDEIDLDAPAVTADIAADGSFLVAGDADNSLVLVDLTGATPKSFELPEHGAVVDHLAISPDGTKVAAASLDGRVHIVDCARERFVAGLPLTRLASHAATPKMIARRLDDAPGTFPDTAFLREQTAAREDVPAAIVFGSYPSLAAAQAGLAAMVRAHGTSLGLPVAVAGNSGLAAQAPAQIYLREGAYRTAIQVSFGQIGAVLQQVRKLAPETADAYARVLQPWCPNSTAREGYTACGRPTPPPVDARKS